MGKRMIARAQPPTTKDTTAPPLKPKEQTAKVYVSFYELVFEQTHIDMSRPLSPSSCERVLTRCASLRSERDSLATTAKYKLKRTGSGMA